MKRTSCRRAYRTCEEWKPISTSIMLMPITSRRAYRTCEEWKPITTSSMLMTSISRRAYRTCEEWKLHSRRYQDIALALVGELIEPVRNGNPNRYCLQRRG